MNFGLIEALEKGLKAPAEELNKRLDRLIDLLEGMTHEQRETNRLLTELAAKPARGGVTITNHPADKLPRTRGGKVMTS